MLAKNACWYIYIWKKWLFSSSYAQYIVFSNHGKIDRARGLYIIVNKSERHVYKNTYQEICRYTYQEIYRYAYREIYRYAYQKIHGYAYHEIYRYTNQIMWCICYRNSMAELGWK